MVATIKALKLHGGASDDSSLSSENLLCLEKGLPNLIKHISNMIDVYHIPTVVTLNKYATDTQKEVDLVKKLVSPYAKLIINDVWGKGGEGAIDLAHEVIEACNQDYDFKFAYELSDSPEEKINKIVTKIYGGKQAVFTDKAKAKLAVINKLKLNDYPVVIAKTQYSLSDDAKRVGRPTDFDVTVRDIEIKTGAGFLVAICGSMLLMPGLSAHPASEKMTIDKDGNIEGIF